MSLNIGDKIPEFELYNHNKAKHSDKDFLGQIFSYSFILVNEEYSIIKE